MCLNVLLHSDQLCLLIEVFNLLTFNIITGICGHIFGIKFTVPFVFYIPYFLFFSLYFNEVTIIIVVINFMLILAS